jgi:hypothetical protein
MEPRMNEPEFEELPRTVPVRPRWSPRAALRSLAVAIVGGVLLGFVLGFTAAPKVEPSTARAPVAVAPAVVAVSPPIPSVEPSAQPNATVELPPADALALSAALAAFDRNNGRGASSAAVISVRLTTVAGAEAAMSCCETLRQWVERTSAAGSSLAAPLDELVWAFIVRGSFPAASCGGYAATPDPCPPPATTMLVLLDARTGEFVLAVSPALT